MNQEPTKQRPLALSHNNYKIEEAFIDDVLDRKIIADKLTGYLDRLRVGAVLAIDAPWGSGKTWFGRHWAEYLRRESNKHTVVYIDTFATDYIEDPFLLIAAEIAAELNDKDKSTSELIQRSTTDVMKAILPISTKILINIAGRLILGTSNLPDEINKAVVDTNKEIADATSKLIKKKLEDHIQEKAALQNFRNMLIEFCGKEEKPVVIIIDELDRCRPNFAVRLIECIKHLFDVPNLVFVLLLNRKQLENAIRGVYGSETDATTYLSKFVNLFLRLPKNHSINTTMVDHPTTKFIAHMLERFNIEDYVTLPNLEAENFKTYLSFSAIAMDMSLRDIEHACALFVMSNNKNQNQAGFIAYLIALKITDIDLYTRLVRNESSAHEEAINRLDKWISNKKQLNQLKILFGGRQESSRHNDYFKTLRDIHQYIARSSILEDEALTLYEFYSRFGNNILGTLNIKNCFLEVSNMIDLPIELK